MYVLKDNKCERCGDKILLVPFKDFEKGRPDNQNQTVVSHGECVGCSKNVILPCEEYYDFIRRFGEPYGE